MAEAVDCFGSPGSYTSALVKVVATSLLFAPDDEDTLSEDAEEAEKEKG